MLPGVQGMTRRTALRATAALVAAGAVAACTPAPGTPSPTDPGGPEDPDRVLRATIGSAEQALSALYLRAAAVLPRAGAAAVTTLGARHAAYRVAVDPDGLATRPPTQTPTDSTSPASTPSPAPTYPAVTAANALTVLRDAETAAARDRARQCAQAVDPDLARIVALTGAGCAAAASWLDSRRAAR